MTTIARLPLVLGYAKYQEAEADAQGMRVLVQAGYDPHAAAAPFARFQKMERKRPSPRPVTPVGELASASREAMESYFRTHPASEERVRRLESIMEEWRGLSGRSFYAGRENYRLRIPKSQKQFPGESTEWR